MRSARGSAAGIPAMAYVLARKAGEEAWVLVSVAPP